MPLKCFTRCTHALLLRFLRGDCLKFVRCVQKRQRRNLPSGTCTFFSSPPPPHPPIPPSVISPTCACQERCSCHLPPFVPSPSDPLFLPGPSINVKMRQNVAILYLHPHSVLIPSLYPQPFPQLHLFNSPHHSSPSACLPALSLLTRFLSPAKALSSSRSHPPVQQQASTHLSTYTAYMGRSRYRR